MRFTSQNIGMLLAKLLLVVNQAVAADTVGYLNDVQPILAEHCFQCHGPDEAARQAELRLDVRDAAIAPLPSEAIAVTPGAPAESELMRRIASMDDDTVMPPPHFAKPLSADQRETLRKWIESGAEYQQHWGFRPPRRVALDKKVNPIDELISQRLSQDGLQLSPRAAPEILCRRIHLDLIGLPPSPAEVERFVDAARDNFVSAIDGEVQRLFASPHYGEKWARHWLDVARYSDSNGYEKDLPRDQWAWRDWVIQAINDDMPYDRFIIEQLAGDLLPGATQDQVIATGFLRNNMLNEEGAIVPEQFRMDGMFDRLDCIGKAMLGLTLQCAQCHSHKYDPIPQDEYYGIMAMLNNADDAKTHVYSVDQLQTIREVGEKLKQIRESIKTARPHWQAELQSWVEKQVENTIRWEILDTYEATWVGGSNHPEKLADRSIVVLGHPSAAGDMYIRAEHDLDGVTGLRLEALTHGDLPFGGPGRGMDRGTFALSELTVQIKTPDNDAWVDTPLKNATADFSSPDQLLSTLPLAHVPEENKQKLGPVAYLIDGDINTAWYSDRGPGRRNTDSVAVMQFVEPLRCPAGTHIQIRFAQHHNRNTQPDALKQGVLIIGRFRVAVTRSSAPVAPPYEHAVSVAINTPLNRRTEQQDTAIFDTWVRHTPELKGHHDKIEKTWSKYPDNPKTSVLSLSKREQNVRRKTYLLDRGVWDQPKYEVRPKFLSVLHINDPSDEPDRLQLARWLVDARSPLAARVQVNRVWQALFGMGLVETSEDFGTRAAQSEYLPLLDSLAVEFMEHNWSQQWLLSKIVSSKVYQQSSQVGSALLNQDPQNRRLARGPRFRVEAEIVRDLALSAAGLLHTEVGGPSFFPPVPESVINYNFTVPKYWEPAPAPTRYRRSLYMFRKRTMPDPVMSTFDAPSGDTSCARRTRSNTPLGALTTLNEPIFIEAARGLALRVLAEGGDTEQTRIDYLFRLCTSRSATVEEQEELLRLLVDQRQRLAEGWLSINEIATGNADQIPELPEATTPQDFAAWVIASRVVLNLDATLSKN
ncbi:MAG: PSD1 and planctomycete cytochrome C domain-containing protein [Planctomycetota bacterium]